MDAVPVFVAVDVIYIISSTPLSDSSRGTMTLFSTVSALAPVYVADTRTVGGAMLGNCSIGNWISPNMPSATINTEITPESMGRSIKVFTVMILQFYDKFKELNLDASYRSNYKMTNCIIVVANDGVATAYLILK